MRMTRLALFTFLISLLSSFISHLTADVRLPSIIADRMIFQQKSDVKIWGWADPGEKISVQGGWMKSSISTMADREGKWLVTLKTVKAGGPYTITIKGNNTIVVKDVLLGEVWICSGQSNMEFTIKMLGGWDFYRTEKEELDQNNFSAIRLCQVQKAMSDVPVDTCSAVWMHTNSGTVEKFSATAYFFGRELYRRLRVPIGLISTNWGGTAAEAWTPESSLQTAPLDFYLQNPNGPSATSPNRHSVLYNAMVHPLIKYGIRGAIWYQGESNRNDADRYHQLFATMIRSWRERFAQGEFPFYYVQIAPFRYEEQFHSSAYLREAQLHTLSVPNTGMAVTMDIGNVNDIHPKNKQEVGRRLSLWALAKTYGKKVDAVSGPMYHSLRMEEHRIRLFFDHAENGLMVKGRDLTGFTIAGSDWKFHPAQAALSKNTVLVWNNDIPQPVAVRFAFTNTDSSVLYNVEGLPASSFRTDTQSFYYSPVSITIMWNDAKQSASVAMRSSDQAAQVRYTTDGSDPGATSHLYSGEFTLSQSTHLKARAYKEEIPSLGIAEARFTRHHGLGKTITYTNTPSQRYPGTAGTLTDGLQGSLNYRDGRWQGFEGVDCEATIDLGMQKPVTRIGVSFIQNIASWVFLPEQVDFSVSDDGVSYRPVLSIKNIEPQDRRDIFTKQFQTGPLQANARYLKVRAKNIAVCPDWHPGKGGKAWLFVDEVVVE